MCDWGDCIAAQLVPPSEAGKPPLTCHTADLSRDCVARHHGDGNTCLHVAAPGTRLALALTRLAQLLVQLATTPYAPPLA